jgi:hypothetical protein
MRFWIENLDRMTFGYGLRAKKDMELRGRLCSMDGAGGLKGLRVCTVE